MACSLACLERHQAEVHGDVPTTDTATRMRAFQREMNRCGPHKWEGYAPHRRRVMELVAEKQAGPDICVLGAGTCSDIDLEQLAGLFSEVHVVDLDGEALEGAWQRQSVAVRDRLVLHADIDLSGMLGSIDQWGDTFPGPSELAPLAVAAAHHIIRRIGGAFSMTISTGVLSQLTFPFRRVWVRTQSEWESWAAATTATHVATLAGTTRPGGTGIIIVDALSSGAVPLLRDCVDRSSVELAAFVSGEVEAGRAVLDPDPTNLLAQLSSPGWGTLFRSPELSQPWLWDTGHAIQLVYGIVFQRAS